MKGKRRVMNGLKTTSGDQGQTDVDERVTTEERDRPATSRPVEDTPGHIHLGGVHPSATPPPTNLAAQGLPRTNFSLD